jgi:hypothetical protein
MTIAAARFPEDAEVIDYDALYADYAQSLVDMLRGFSAKVRGLELWVPDENLRVSLRNLLDSAASLGRASVCLQLGETTAAQLTEAELLELGHDFGQARVERRGASLVFEVRGLGTAPAPAPQQPPERKLPVTAERQAPAAETTAVVNPRPSGVSFDGYAQALRGARLSKPTGPRAPADAATVTVKASHADCSLELVVSTSQHVVHSATSDAPDETRGQLLTELCRIIEGLPVLEACYHGALRLEHRLRPLDQPRPVSGIVLPRAVHPHFGLVEDLLRGALAEYRKLTGFATTQSHHDDRPAAGWLSSSADERRRLLEAALAEVLPILGLQLADASVVSIRYDVRVELGLSEAWKKLDQPRLVMALERELQTRVDARLEVYVQELKDKNQLRRLALVETP